MADTYTPTQVYDSLIRQGIDETTARAMARAMGNVRRDQDQIQRAYKAIGVKGVDLPSGDDGAQGSSFAPNLGEGIGFVAGSGLGSIGARKGGSFLRKLRPWGGGLAGSILGTMAGEKLSGTNFYDRASDEQLLADIGGSIGGGFLGEAAGTKATEKLAGKAANVAAKTGAKRLLGAGLGRLLGGAAGSVLPLVGSIGGAALGGWLLPKLFSDGSKKVKDDEDSNQNFVNPFA